MKSADEGANFNCHEMQLDGWDIEIFVRRFPSHIEGVVDCMLHSTRVIEMARP